MMIVRFAFDLPGIAIFVIYYYICALTPNM